MDFQHREGGKTGSGNLLSASESNAERRERLRKLALETIDLTRDPYFMKNHLGSYECRLCLTLHVNEGSYLVHTQGKKHQANLGRRRAREAAQASAHGGSMLASGGSSAPASAPAAMPLSRTIPKIGRPGYRLVKIRDPVTRYVGFRLLVHYPHPFASPPMPPSGPLTRFMSTFEQRLEPPNRLVQYLLVAAVPYEMLAIRVPAREIAETWSWWDADTRLYTHQLLYRAD